MDINALIADELKVKKSQVDAAVELLDEGNTIPFIARYRKEVTGGLDDDALRVLGERLEYLRGLEDRKQTVLSTIEEAGKLTDDLRRKIDVAQTLAEVEDIYRPYKPKRRTRATIAKERGLEPLAEIIKTQELKTSLNDEAEKYVDPENDVHVPEDAVQGACDIIAEEISDNADFRSFIREKTKNEGLMVSAQKKENAPSVYEMYYDYSEKVSTIPGHRVLAMNRGEKEDFLTVKITAPVDDIKKYLEKQIITNDNPNTAPALKNAVSDAYDRLIAPSIEREIRSDLTEMAEDGAIKVFSANLRQLLLAPPIAGKTVLGWDPGFNHGCKLAVCDPTGKILTTDMVFPFKPKNDTAGTVKKVLSLIDRYSVDLIALGNGTASRESEALVAEIIKSASRPVQYVIVNEAGASVYSASELAAKELPDLDVEGRGAASMARRLIDPLSELVKIDPKAIGVGQYQHDMNQKKLSEALSGVVEAVVNSVGVDVNTASAPLLSYVAGISKTVSNNILTYREENGSFGDRQELLKVKGLGPKAFEQCAGFLRIRDGKEPLDNTGVHPESYDKTKQLLGILGFTEDDLKNGNLSDIDKKTGPVDELAEKLDIGVPTLTDIIKELKKPGRDPREEMPKPILRSDVLSMDDLKPGMKLKGTVRNIVDFGAFVDIGVHEDGLVHISQISNRHIKHPLDVLSIGDIVDVTVLDVDKEKGRISLTMKNDAEKSDNGKAEKQNGRRENDRRDSGKRNAARKSDKNNRHRDSDKKNNRGGKNNTNRPDRQRGNSRDVGTNLGSLLSGLKLD
ncbi:MAG: RNA-binding transcriptional accessory protein [bacterium LCO1.1]|uniref:RNA-binding transcriptional accessory protein n=1 Tax=Candidatus Weimeria bifida TaxID=2599074 RepID=A0A6N7J2J0_9FIRM|nr:RNA-binding transcriptional accessory protein [Candidatus Weimeria bifida]